MSCEACVLAELLRAIRTITDEALEVLSPEFDGLYAKVGRPSIPPEKLPQTLLSQAFYSVRLECQLMERTGYTNGLSL